MPILSLSSVLLSFSLSYPFKCLCLAHIYWYNRPFLQDPSEVSHSDPDLNRRGPYTLLSEWDVWLMMWLVFSQNAGDETDHFPLIRSSVILLKAVPLFSPLDTHCPNLGFRGKGIKGNYNISFTSRLRGLTWKSNAITWWQRWRLKPMELPVSAT